MIFIDKLLRFDCPFNFQNLQSTQAQHIVAEIGLGAGTLVLGSSQSLPYARDGRYREV
jgi:hypothetical protein